MAVRLPPGGTPTSDDGRPTNPSDGGVPSPTGAPPPPRTFSSPGRAFGRGVRLPGTSAPPARSILDRQAGFDYLLGSVRAAETEFDETFREGTADLDAAVNSAADIPPPFSPAAPTSHGNLASPLALGKDPRGAGRQTREPAPVSFAVPGTVLGVIDGMAPGTASSSVFPPAAGRMHAATHPNPSPASPNALWAIWKSATAR